jgi:hypothetical protein
VGGVCWGYDGVELPVIDHHLYRESSLAGPMWPSSISTRTRRRPPLMGFSRSPRS